MRLVVVSIRLIDVDLGVSKLDLGGRKVCVYHRQADIKVADLAKRIEVLLFKGHLPLGYRCGLK